MHLGGKEVLEGLYRRLVVGTLSDWGGRPLLPAYTGGAWNGGQRVEGIEGSSVAGGGPCMKKGLFYRDASGRK